MKEKYVYVQFNGTNGLYIYFHPNFKLKKGYLVEVETGISMSEAIVIKITKHKENALPISKEKIKNIKKVVNKNRKSNLNSLREYEKISLIQRLKWLCGFKRVKKDGFVYYVYKNNNEIGIFYCAEDNSYLINLKTGLTSFYDIFCIGKNEYKHTLFLLKKLIKQYVKKEITIEQLRLDVEKLG